MNVSELPLLFPAVLTGDCPLDVLADACGDCGFAELDFFVRRMEVVENEPAWILPWLVVVKEVDSQDKPTGRWQAVTRNDGTSWWVRRTREEAEQTMRQLAVHHVEWAIRHGEAARELPPMKNGDVLSVTHEVRLS